MRRVLSVVLLLVIVNGSPISVSQNLMVLSFPSPSPSLTLRPRNSSEFYMKLSVDRLAAINDEGKVFPYSPQLTLLHSRNSSEFTKLSVDRGC